MSNRTLDFPIDPTNFRLLYTLKERTFFATSYAIRQSSN